MIELPQSLRRPFAVVDLAVAGSGFVPIACLCAAVFGALPLSVTAAWVVAPLTFLVVGVALRDRNLGDRALRGFAAGVVATGLYDVFRVGVMLSGAWADFIPAIGRMALADPVASPIWGYLWRYVYDGGAMGMTFALLGGRGARAGATFGAAICGCLFVTLLTAPGAQAAMFVLGPATAASAMTGHLIYGAALGRLVGVGRPVPGRGSQARPDGNPEDARHRVAERRLLHAGLPRGRRHVALTRETSPGPCRANDRRF